LPWAISRICRRRLRAPATSAATWTRQLTSLHETISEDGQFVLK
jgi:hypothetical protein